MSCPSENERVPGRLEELRRKMQDEEYIAGAIQRIALVLSAEIIDRVGVRYGGRQTK